jgi:aryl-alcohol dehydrogenase-like predicted oxidoreductase
MIGTLLTGQSWAALVLQAIADRKGISAAQLSLAWLRKKALSLGVSMLPIPGSTKLANAQVPRGLRLGCPCFSALASKSPV